MCGAEKGGGRWVGKVQGGAGNTETRQIVSVRIPEFESHQRNKGLHYFAYGAEARSIPFGGKIA